MTRQPYPRPGNDRDLVALREATREAHEAIKDLRALVKEAREARDELFGTIATSTTELIGMAVSKGLAEYRTALDTAIEQATAAVYKRFDLLTDLVLGNTRQQRREHDGMSIEDDIRALAEIREQGREAGIDTEEVERS